MRELNLNYLRILSRKSRYDIVRMIANAGSGHIGGSLSSIDIYLLLLEIMSDDDRLIVSHGHSAAAIYSALGNNGYFDIEDAVKTFRKDPPYEGHPSLKVNGISWCSGSLGQGLSVACGFALAKKLKGEDGRVFVVMGDGEQQKGQLQEAREFAVTHGLDNLVAIIDFNGLQASGNVSDITCQVLSEKYIASGWRVVSADGHDFDRLYSALEGGGPLCVIAETVMGKGITAIEGDYRFHGTVMSDDVTSQALRELALTDEESALLTAKIRDKKNNKIYEYPSITYKKAMSYKPGDFADVRSAFGKALSDVAAENPDVHMAAFDCDLEGSVKLTDFKNIRPASFVECGIAEHNAATVAAGVSKCGVIAVHADFSVFNIAETYSQNRMADINNAPVKLIATHAGLDVGEDGKTHQCIDYVSLMSNLHGFKVIVPADANQGECAMRYALSVPYPVAVVSGRSKLPVLSYTDGRPLDFEYGRAEWLREGTYCTVITYGNMVHKAIEVADSLCEYGISVGVLNIPTPCDIDRDAVIRAAETGFVITYEDHNVNTGIRGSVAAILCEAGISCRFRSLGVTHYGSSSAPDKLYAEQGIDRDGLMNLIKS